MKQLMNNSFAILVLLLMVSCGCDETVLSTRGLRVATLNQTQIRQIRALPDGNTIQVNAREGTIMLLSNDTICEFEFVTSANTGRVKLAYSKQLITIKPDSDCSGGGNAGLIYSYNNIRIVSHNYPPGKFPSIVQQDRFDEKGVRYPYILQLYE